MSKWPFQKTQILTIGAISSAITLSSFIRLPAIKIIALVALSTILFFSLFKSKSFQKPQIFEFIFFIISGAFILRYIELLRSETSLTLEAQHDLANIILLIIFCLLTSRYFKHRDLILSLAKWEICIGLFLALLGIAKLAIYFINIDWINTGKLGAPGGTSLASDYNIYALSMLVAIISCYWTVKNSKQLILLITPLTIALALSGSRKGFALAILFFLTIFIFSLNKKKYSWLYSSITGLFLLITLPLSSLVIRESSFYKSSVYIESLARSVIYPTTRYTDLIIGIAKPPTNLTPQAGIPKPSLQTPSENPLRPSTLSDSRNERISYALNLMKSQYDLKAYLIGNGLNMSSYEKRFSQKGEHPHSFLLSSFMATGFIGTVLLLILFGKASFSYFIYRAEDFSSPTKLIACTLYALTSGLTIWSILLTGTYLVLGIKLKNFDVKK